MFQWIFVLLSHRHLCSTLGQDLVIRIWFQLWFWSPQKRWPQTILCLVGTFRPYNIPEMSCECDGLCCASPLDQHFSEWGEEPGRVNGVHCSGRRICSWRCLETTAANCHDFAFLSPDGCSQGPQLKDNPLLLTTLYLLDAVVAHHSCVGEIGLFSTLILVLSSIFLSKCTRGILWWITACWAVSQSLNLAAVKDGHLHCSEKTGVELLSL